MFELLGDGRMLQPECQYGMALETSMAHASMTLVQQR
jgi:hypothetical protein